MTARCKAKLPRHTRDALARIIGRVASIDARSKRAERTDLDDVWTTLYAIRDDARRALRRQP